MKKIFTLLIAISCSVQLTFAQQDTYVATTGNVYTHPNGQIAIFGNLINDALGGVNHNNGGDVHLYRDALTGTGNSRIYDGPTATVPTDNYNAGGAFVRFYNLFTDNTVGVATPSGTNINTNSGGAPVQIEQESRISNLHTFVNGMIWTPRADWKHAYVHYESAALYSGNSDTKHIDGYAASTDKSNFDYPIGEGTRQRISGIVSAANGTFKHAYFQKNAQLGTTGISGNNASTGPMNGGIIKVNATEFWDIDGTASSQFKLTALNSVSGYSDWNTATNFAGLMATNTLITAFDPWENLSINSAPASHNADGAFITTVATMPDVAFSAYTWANAPISIPLPVDISDFGIVMDNCKAIISWKAFNEENLKEIIIERLEGSGSFAKIASLAPYNTNELHSYSYTDNNNFLNDESYSYRLSFIDIDGSITYSQVKKIINNCKPGEAVVSVYPNPTSGNVVMEFLNISNETNLSVNVINSIGQTVFKKEIGTDGIKKYTFSMNLNNLTNGLYYLNVQGNNNLKKSMKIIIDK